MVAGGLPQQATPFIGREAELAKIAQLLGDPNCRLLTLLGPGGIGKTRLSLRAAADHAARFADGVYFAPLAPVVSPELIPAAIAAALDITLFVSDEPFVQIIQYLREKRLLVVIDNFEHLLEGTGLLTEILQTAPGVKILATSRERLNVQEEWVFTLDGLSFPSGQSVGALESYSAVQLFVQRARQIQTGFSLDHNAGAVQAICQQVEGVPLGLELAATWLRVMTCQEIAAQMTGKVDFLTTPLRNVPERHRSLRAVFDQSWRLLLTGEQAALMKLSVFRGGFDRETAEQVAGATLPILASLLDKSLIRLNAAGRYDLHELLRQYAAEKLAEIGETEKIAQRHFDYFLELAEQAEAHQFGREQIPWFDRLEIELDNLRVALTYSTRSAEAETGLRLAAALGWFFSERLHVIEGTSWLEQMLEASPDAPATLRAKALHSLASQSGLLADERRARMYCQAALDLARTANDSWNTAWSLSHFGFYVRQDLNQAAALLDESLVLFRELHDSFGLCHGFLRRGWIAIDQHDYPAARTLLEACATIAHEAGDKIASAWVHQLLGLAAWLQNRDFEQATSNYEKSLSLFLEARFVGGAAETLCLIGAAEQSVGHDKHAQRLYEKAFFLMYDRMGRLGNYVVLMDLVFIGLVGVARGRGQFRRAACLLGIAEYHVSTYGRSGYRDVFSLADESAAVSAQMGEVAFAEAYASGKAMTFSEVMDFAFDGRIQPIEILTEEIISPPVSRSQHPDLSLPEALSVRELEVLRLIADGLSNAEIAAKLYLSVGTVKVHSRSIYGKLGVNSRMQAVSRARELGLLT